MSCYRLRLQSCAEHMNNIDDHQQRVLYTMDIHRPSIRPMVDYRIYAKMVIDTVQLRNRIEPNQM